MNQLTQEDIDIVISKTSSDIILENLLKIKSSEPTL